MNSWQRVNQYLLAVSRAFGATLHLRTWTPFLVYTLAQAAAAAILYLGVRPPLNGFFYALPDLCIPPDYFSYPMHLFLIPRILYHQAMVPMGLFMESLLQAAATWIFVCYALSEPIPTLGPAIRKVRLGYWQFVFFWAVNFALLEGSGALFNLASGDLWSGFARRRAALEFAQFAFGSVSNSFLAYSTIVIVVEGTTFSATFRLALRSFKRHWLATILTVLAGTLLTVPFAMLIGNAPSWIAKFNPEVILAATGLTLLAGAVASYLVTAILSFWYLMHRTNS